MAIIQATDLADVSAGQSNDHSHNRSQFEDKTVKKMNKGHDQCYRWTKGATVWAGLTVVLVILPVLGWFMW